MPADDRLTDAVDAAARRAREGFALDDLLAAYRVGVRHLVAETASGIDDADALRQLADLSLAYLDHLSRVVADAFADARGHLAADDERLHAELVDLLLTHGPQGAPTTTRARRFGIRLGRDHLVAVARTVAGTPHEHADALRATRTEPRVLVAGQADTLVICWPDDDGAALGDLRRWSAGRPPRGSRWVGPEIAALRDQAQEVSLADPQDVGVVVVDSCPPPSRRSWATRPPRSGPGPGTPAAGRG